jgi:hypothetical protein
MAVFYNSHSGQYMQASQSLNPVSEADFLADEARLHTGTGWHEYSSIAEMNAAIAANKWPAATTSINPAKVLGGSAQSAAKSVAQSTGLGSVTDFLTGLTSANLWIRVAKVAIGGVLLIVGLAKLTGLDNKVTNAAIKAAPLL